MSALVGCGNARDRLGVISILSMGASGCRKGVWMDRWNDYER